MQGGLNEAVAGATWTTKRMEPRTSDSGYIYADDRYWRRSGSRAPRGGRDVVQSHAAWVTDYRRIVGVNGGGRRASSTKRPSEGTGQTRAHYAVLGRLQRPHWRLY